MPTRIEIIAQIDSEISRLERARDYLVAALAESNIISTRKAKTKIPAKNRRQAAAAPAAAVAPAAAAAPVPPPKQEPQVHRVPPKRRMERRQLTTEKVPAAALRGFVPAGPVAVSANEARKMQERSAPPPPPPPPIESAVIGSERSLGSLIQAFERRAGLNGIEIP
jgi:hypothetical protein